MSSNVHYNLVPTNLTSTGVQGFKQGNPVIRFEIPENDHFLIASSMRLAGKFQVFKKNGEVSASGLQMNQRLGVLGAIDQLSFASQTTKTQIETIRHYNKFLGSYFNSTTNFSDNMTNMSETNLTMPNYETMSKTVVELPSTKLTGNSFCVPLIAGITSGNSKIDLSMTSGIGGCEVTLTLTPDSNFLYSDSADSTDITDAFYQFRDLHLICEATVPTAQEWVQIRSNGPSTLEYNSIASYFQTINNTNAQINMVLGKSRVLGVFGSFLPAAYINNLSEDSLATMPIINAGGSIAQITQLVFTRGGVRFPLQYNIDTIHNADAKITQVDAQIIRNYLNAVKDFSTLERTSASPLNTKVEDGLNDKLAINGGNCFGVGVSYTNISDQGVDFSNTPFGLQITSGLTSNNPTAFYLFAHCKNTLVMGGGGRIQVIS
tara:strand:- start:2516 stop:3814 length:1299 start_codon:yes stop_codon:yes gene_type:complete